MSWSIDQRVHALDAHDPLAVFRDLFDIPRGLIYLDGNSLGCMPVTALTRLHETAGREWAHGLIRSWGESWLRLPFTAGDRIAPLIGAGAGEVVVGDSTSVNLFKCLAAALALRSDRRVILAEEHNFPTDTYIVQGLAAFTGTYDVRYVGSGTSIEDALDAQVAAVVLSHVHYRTAEIRDLAAITEAAHRVGALIIWDLSHSTGAVPVDLAGAGADFAVGCTYKYLNGGPGAPAFTWVSPRFVNACRQPLSGWMGHRDPFAFERDYEAGPAVKRFLCGTPQILSLSALDESLKIWRDLDMSLVREKSIRLTELFIELVETECAGHGLTLQSPRASERRGSHVSIGLHQGYAVMRAMAEHGVIGDFRAPDTMRFGFAPLYISFADIQRTVQILKAILHDRLWDREHYKIRAEVT